MMDPHAMSGRKAGLVAGKMVATDCNVHPITPQCVQKTKKLVEKVTIVAQTVIANHGRKLEVHAFAPPPPPPASRARPPSRAALGSQLADSA